MPAPSDSARHLPQKTLYGRRKGPKLSAHQSRLIETLLPQLQLDLRENADPREYFAADVEEVWFEIGFGAGEHLLWQAEHSPNVGIIGAEPYESGVAKLLSKLYAISAPLFPSPAPHCYAREGNNSERGQADLLSRILLYTDDARDIIGALPDASLGRVFLLFPDPWPKNRHHKRRFMQMETLDALARVMKPGAELRFASDDAGYVQWTLEHIRAHSAFAWLAERPADWLSRPSDWPATRYEQKALHGAPLFFRFQRCTQASP